MRQDRTKRRKIQRSRFKAIRGGAAFLAFLLVGVAIIAFAARTSPAGLPTEPPINVMTIPAEWREGFETTIFATGVVEARRATDLGFERAGTLREVYVVEGSSVTYNQPLAKLDTRALDAEKLRLEAQNRAAGALLAELINGARIEDVLEARADVRRLEADLNLAATRLQRTQEALEEDAVNDLELDQATFQRDAANAALDAAEARLAELVAGERAERIDAQAAEVERLDAAIARIDVDLEDSVIKAPFNGRVGRALADKGSVVASGAPVLRVVETGALEAWIGVPERDAASLQIGKTRPLRIAGSRADAEIVAVMPEVDRRTRTVRVAFRVPASLNATPGAVARVELTSEVEQRGVWLPTDALAPGRRGLWRVIVAENAGSKYTAKAVDVELLHTEPERVFIRGAIDPGDLVITSGAHRSPPGADVDPSPPDSLAAGRQ